jgi:NitT/TauT family transport system permease protein
LQAALQVRLPAMMPLYMAGLRIAIAKCVKGMINGEMFVAAMGLGALVMQAGSTFDATTVLAVMLVVMVVAFVSIAIVNAIDRRVTSWVGSTERRIEG